MSDYTTSGPLTDLIPLPLPLEGAWLVEVQFRDGQERPVLEKSWMLAGWTKDGRNLPVVIETDGRLQAKQTARGLMQTIGGSDLCFATRIAPSRLDVTTVQREIKDMWRSANNPPAQTTPSILRATVDAVPGL